MSKAEKKLYMLLLDAEHQKVSVVAVKPELERYYQLLNCTCIDIVSRKVGDAYYDIICDDEGLLKNDPVVSGVIINKEGEVQPILFGNLLFCNTDGEGNEVGLTNDDLDNLLRNIIQISDENDKEYYVMKMDF